MVSLAVVMMAIQPLGGVQTATVGGNARVDVDDAIVVAVIVAVGVSLRRVGIPMPIVVVGDGIVCGRVGGTWEGALEGGRVSASASEMPPSTRITETIAIMGLQ